MVNTSTIILDRHNKIGVGSFSRVFTGSFEGQQVAVKRVEKLNSGASDRIRSTSAVKTPKYSQTTAH